MKKLIIILLLSVFSVQLFSQVVKLTDGKPAWIPSYLILDGGLYFRNSGIYTSFGDSLDYYINKSDSIYFYYTQRQVDSAITAGGSVSFGTQNQIPYMNVAGTDLDYSSNFTWDGTVFNALSNAQSFIKWDGKTLHVKDSANVNIGFRAGNSSGNPTGYYNTSFGYDAGYSYTTGDFNTFLGAGSGYSLVSGNGNIFLGYQAGYSETGSSKLYIENSNSATPLIYGDFANDTVRINGTLDVTNTISGKGIMQIAKAEVLFSNTAQTTIITLPADAVIWDIGVNVITAFNDSGVDNILVGNTSTEDDYLDDLNDWGGVEVTGFSSVASYGSLAPKIPISLTGETNITFTYISPNADATAGQAFIYIHYTTF